VLLEWHARVVVGLLCFCAWGCDRLPTLGVLSQSSEPASQAAQTPRYQLQKDRLGRVIRLDTVTGETSVVEPAATPARPGSAASDESAKSTSLPSSSTEADASPSDPSDLPKPPSSIVASETEPTPPPVEPTSGADVCSREDAFRDGVTLADVPVYVEPRTLETPLTTLPSAVMVTVGEREGDWYLVRFEDARWGPRAGYVHCSGLRALERPVRQE
jgi:hypothetical protein